MKDYYALLTIAADASADDIKRAFRREIARYHPDKVHHLGAEFQALAAERAAELTEAYRVLMDEGLREAYDRERRGSGGASAAAAPRPRAEPAAPPSAPRRDPAPAPPAPDPAPPPGRAAPHASRDAFVRRMSMTRFRDAIERALEGVTSMPARGFEASYFVKGKRSLFGKAVPERLLSAYVGEVTGEAITKLGQDAIGGRGSATLLTVFALGDALAPASDLSAAIVNVRKRAPAGVTLQVVPIDVRDWSAMMPRDASANVRAVVTQLNAKD